MCVDTGGQVGGDPDIKDPAERQARDDVHVERASFVHVRSPIGPDRPFVADGVLRPLRDLRMTAKTGDSAWK